MTEEEINKKVEETFKKAQEEMVNENSMIVLNDREAQNRVKNLYKTATLNKYGKYTKPEKHAA
ncbi:MAG: hypothetical protein HQK79_09000 [Desulfobacterales bacterium]|nr:hypothetical protein [Desulfobacterales bacterium]MBF0397575.1 hypothetical protein [Desulfobacterales bacterium]